VTASDDIAILRIELEDIEPVIRRRAALRTSMNLTAVHARDPGHDELAG